MLTSYYRKQILNVKARLLKQLSSTFCQTFRVVGCEDSYYSFLGSVHVTSLIIYTWNDFVLPFWMPYQKYTHCLRKPVFWNIVPCFGKVPCFCIHLIPTWDSWWIQWYRRRITNTYPALWHNIFVFWGGSPINLNYTGYIIYLPSCYHPARRFSSSFSIRGWTTFLVWGLGKRRVWIWLLSVGFRVPHLPIWFGGVLWVVV